MSDALDMMYAVRLESGKRWGEVAIPHQKADAAAIFSDKKPHRHFLTRPRGASKTTDVAGFAVSWLATEAPRRSRGRVIASSTEQASILIDAAAALIENTPELAGVLEVENERVGNPTTGAWIRVLSQSASGSWGLRDTHFLILDEFAQWPPTRSAQRVYTAIRSTVQKVAGCRMIVLTSAGSPSHWSYPIYKAAKGDPLWRVSEMRGPGAPWQDPEELAALERDLLPGEYDRLVLNIWSEGEDHPISLEDYEDAAEAAQRHGKGYRLHGPRAGVRYAIFLDVGLVNDRTAIAVAHAEPMTEDRHGPHRLVVDHLERWQGSKKNPVQLADVEEWIAETSAAYNKAELLADPDQAAQLIQALNRRGVKARAWNFTSASVGQVATALVQAFRNRLISVPDFRALKDELLRVRLRESATGVARLDHDRSGHDDMAVVIGMACHVLLGKTKLSSKDFFKAVDEARVIRDERLADVDRRRERELRRADRSVQRVTSTRARHGARAAGPTPACVHGNTGRCPRCANGWV